MTPNQVKKAINILNRLESHIKAEMITAQKESPVNAKSRLTTEEGYINSQYAEAKISIPIQTT